MLRPRALPGLGKVERSHLIDQVIAAYRKALKSHIYKPGDRLPSENDMAGQLGVGRSTVREALRVLRHLGLVESRNGRGAFVVRSDSEAGSQASPISADVREIFEFRYALEFAVVRLAAERRSTRHLKALRAAWKRSCEAAKRGNARAFATSDMDFHIRVAEASGNPLLTEAYKAARRLMEDASETLLRLGPTAALLDVHEDLVLAIARRDSRAAVAATERTFAEISTRMRLADQTK